MTASKYYLAAEAIWQASGSTRNAFANAVGVSEGTLRAWKDGKGPNTETIQRICKKLGMTEEEFLAKGDPTSPHSVLSSDLSSQIGDDGVHNSKLILKAIKNVQVDFFTFAQTMAARMEELTKAIEKAEEAEKSAKSRPPKKPKE